MYDELTQITNRFGILFVWIGVWNLISIVVQKDILFNVVLAIIGFIMCVATKEFSLDKPLKYIELREVKTSEEVLS